MVSTGADQQLIPVAGMPLLGYFCPCLTLAGQAFLSLSFLGSCQAERRDTTSGTDREGDRRRTPQVRECSGKVHHPSSGTRHFFGLLKM